MKLRITSIQNFLVFLKRLKSVEKSVILELTNEELFCKVHTADKSVMKYSSVPLTDVLEGDIDWAKLKTDRVKIGIIDVTRLMEAFKHFFASVFRNAGAFVDHRQGDLFGIAPNRHIDQPASRRKRHGVVDQVFQNAL